MTASSPASGGAGVIVTIPPYADFLDEVAAHPRVVGLRLNTVMPVADPLPEVLARLAAPGLPLYVDLKGRQLRVVEAALPPFTAVRISHRIRVSLPADVYFSDGHEHARLVALQGEEGRPGEGGDRLILASSPRRMVGPGESVNVVAPDLEIEGVLTEGDRAWLAAMAEVGLRDVMLSFVEGPDDVAAVRALLPDARVVQKIESRRGLRHVAATGVTHGRLMAARGDLYVEVGAPHEVLAATRAIVQADPQAIVASRILSGLAHDAVPDCAELSDVAWLCDLGYRTFMLGDAVSLRADSVRAALNLLDCVFSSDAGR